MRKLVMTPQYPDPDPNFDIIGYFPLTMNMMVKPINA